jgi:hypothetical protein
MGPAGLTAVFGMGTGVTPPVWSPEKYPAGGQAGPGTLDSEVGSHTKTAHFEGGRVEDYSTRMRQRAFIGLHARFGGSLTPSCFWSK